MANKKEFRISRRGAMMGTAVAAALLALNIGGAYLLFSDSSESEMQQAANQPEEISIVEEETSPAETEVQVQAEPAPLYNTLMQDYYTAKSGIPCNFDFTGYGRDFNLAFEDESYRISLRAITGCEWAFYCFFDIEALQGQNSMQVIEDHVQLVPEIITSDDYLYSSAVGSVLTLMPDQEPEPADGIWHCCVITAAYGGMPLNAAGNSLTIYVGVNDEEQGCLEGIPLDFLPAPAELQTAADPLWYCDPDRAEYMNPRIYFYDEILLGSAEAWIPLNRYTVSPFGIFYITEPYGTELELHNGGMETRMNKSLEFVQGDDVLTATDQSYFGYMNENYKSVAYVHVLFDRPLDITKGVPMLLPLSDETEPFTETIPAEDVKIIQTDAVETKLPETETAAVTIPAEEPLTEIPATQIHLPADLQ